MGVSHMILATDHKGTEGLMVDVDGDPGQEVFSISLGKWATGMRTFGFNAEIGPVSFEEFSDMVDEMIALREKYRK